MPKMQNYIIGLVVSLLLAGILLPIALPGLTSFTSTNSDVQTMVSTVIPIVALIGMVMAFLEYRKNSD